ncbi:TIGR00730 family Rossman fold protein [Candidatus Woesearchaeota archaeon]|nr:TIGR00730 family Rossman fold protein [Candidatus Woesearchaeota archaeon]
MSPFHKNTQYFREKEWTVEKAKKEIEDGLAILNQVNQPMVTFFGSHRVKPGSTDYEHAQRTAFLLGKKGFAIMSGGGPGIMHAANKGATEADVPSIGLQAELLKGEEIKDRIFTHHYSFHFIFVRRFIMSIKSDALIFYPGGYGTLNELFEYLTLMQTGIVDRVPIICVNKLYWQGLFQWLKEYPLQQDLLKNKKKDFDLLQLVDTPEDVVRKLQGRSTIKTTFEE